jgi:hypothetical protein
VHPCSYTTTLIIARTYNRYGLLAAYNAHMPEHTQGIQTALGAVHAICEQLEVTSTPPHNAECNLLTNIASADAWADNRQALNSQLQDAIAHYNSLQNINR